MSDGGGEGAASERLARGARQAQERTRRRFPKAVRLSGADRFTSVIRKGGFAADHTLVVHVLANDLPFTRFGITIPRRTGNAVVRNRWKRLIRESLRHCRDGLPAGYDVVIRPKRGAEPHHRAILRGLPKTVGRAIRRSNPR